MLKLDHSANKDQVTVAIPSVAFQFLQEHGGYRPRKAIRFAGKRVFFKPSKYSPHIHIVQNLLRTHYVDPYAQAEKQKRIKDSPSELLGAGRLVSPRRSILQFRCFTAR